MRLSYLSPSGHRLDVAKTRKDATPENLLRMQIVEMAGKNSYQEEKVSGNSVRGSTSKEPQSKNSKKSDSLVPLFEDKKRSPVYPMLQRKKDLINLKFTSVKKELKDESKSLRTLNLKQEEAIVKEKPSTVLLQRFKNKISPNHGYSDSSDTQEDSKNLRSKSAKATVPSSPGPRKEPPQRPTSTYYKQAPFSTERSNDHKSQKDTKVDCQNHPQSNTKSGHLRQNDIEGCLKCEIKGNAMPTPPQHQGSVYLLSSRRAGLFSASLAAFKRRLRLSSKKFTARLHDDSSSKEDEYVISVDTANNGMRFRQGDTLKQSLHLIQNYPSKSRCVSFNMPSENDSLNVPRTPRIKPQGITAKCAEKPFSDQDSSSHSSRSSHEDDREPQLKTSNYKLKDVGQQIPRGQIRGGLPSVTSAKTYVLETDQLPIVESKNAEPIPLTTHNVRLHDTLVSMYARRARRVEKTRRMLNGDAVNHKNSMIPVIGDYANPNERIEKWLQQIAEHESFEPQTPEPVNNKDSHVLHSCSAETRFDLQETHKTAIFV